MRLAGDGARFESELGEGIIRSNTFRKPFLEMRNRPAPPLRHWLETFEPPQVVRIDETLARPS